MGYTPFSVSKSKTVANPEGAAHPTNKTVANCSNTVAAQKPNESATIATVATIAAPPLENETIPRFLHDRGIKGKTAQALATLAASLAFNPALNDSQKAEILAAFCLFIETTYNNEIALLFG